MWNHQCNLWNQQSHGPDWFHTSKVFNILPISTELRWTVKWINSRVLAAGVLRDCSEIGRFLFNFSFLDTLKQATVYDSPQEVKRFYQIKLTPTDCNSKPNHLTHLRSVILVLKNEFVSPTNIPVGSDWFSITKKGTPEDEVINT